MSLTTIDLGQVSDFITSFVNVGITALNLEVSYYWWNRLILLANILQVFLEKSFF